MLLAGSPLPAQETVTRHAGGQVAESYTLVDGQKHGPAVAYYESGQKQSEGTFEHGMLKGKWTGYYESGQVQATGEAYASYLPNSIGSPLRTGRWTDYHANGQVSQQGGWVENRLHGPAVAYYESGQKQFEGTFEHGMLKGKWTGYHESGRVQSTGEAYASYLPNSIGSPLRTGQWTDYHANGQVSQQGGWVENKLQGYAVTFESDGSKRYEGHFSNGSLVGEWTSYYPNGKVEATGRAYASYLPNDIRLPLRTGLWLEFNEDGTLRESVNYVDNQPGGTVGAATDPDSGVTRVASRNADGSRRIVEVGPDGKVREIRDPLALDSEDVVGLSTDPATGEVTVVRRNPDGTTTVTHGRRGIDEDGNEHIVELDAEGNERRTVLAPDGTAAITRSDGAMESTTVLDPSGGVGRIEREAGGAATHTLRDGDGAVVSERRGPDGELEEIVTQRPDGWVERADPDGSRRSTLRDPDGTTTTVEVDPLGNSVTTVTDASGRVTRREEDRVAELEPGRRYFEQVLAGDDWEALPESLKHRYAESEGEIRELEASRAREDAEAARQRVVEAERAVAAEHAARETAAAFDALRTEQDEADRRAAERAASERRRREVEECLDKGKELRRQHTEALARGDQAEAGRIAELVDEHAAASMEILRPTEEESREMERRAEVRQRLASQLNQRATAIAEGVVGTDAAWQDAKDAITGKTKWVSLGSQMQQDTSGTTRMADRQRALARAKQQEIQRMLGEGNRSAEEREILSQMQDLALVQEEGASRLLADNARITAAGYAIDAALTVSGGKLVEGGRRLAVGAAERFLAKEAATTATAIVAERGVIELAGAGATRVAAGATERIVGSEAAETVTRVLGTDVSTPAFHAAERAARRVVGDRALDAAGAAVTRAATLAATDVRAVPGALREAVAGQAAGAETRAAGSIARGVSEGALPRAKTPAAMTRAERQAYNDARADEAVRRAFKENPPTPADELGRRETAGGTEAVKRPSEMTPAERQAYNDRMADRAVREARSRRMPEVEDDVLPGPPEPRDPRPFTREEVEALHQPGRDLTASELQRKAELYRQREQARLAAERAAAERRPVGEIQEQARRLEDLNRMIEGGRGTRVEPPSSAGRMPAPGERPAPPVRPPTVGEARAGETAALPPASTGGPRGTQVLPPDAAAGPLHGNPTMDLEALRSFATTPRVRTVGDSRRLARFSDFRKFEDPVAAVEARSAWLKVPETRRAAIDADLRAALDEAAAMGDKWSRRLQKELNDGTFDFSYEPGIAKYDGLATAPDHAIVNPLDNGSPRTGDELASILVHEYAHRFRGARKWAADYKPGFVGAAEAGQYNEARAFLAEAIFNRNLAKARQLNGRPLDPTAAGLLNRYMDVSSLAAQAPGTARGARAVENLRQYLVDNIYGPRYKDNPALAAERLAAFRGGSMENIQKYLRESLQRSEGDADEVLEALLDRVRAEGGRFLPEP